MTDYSDVIFPQNFAINAKVTELWPNDDVITRVQRRYPVPLRSSPFREVEIVYGPKRQELLDEVRAIFHAMNGTQHTFRFIDPQDNNSSDPESAPTNLDQNIGTGDGVTAAFQLRKRYTAGATAVLNRSITNIVPLSDVVAVAGVSRTRGVHYNIDNATGIITFTGGNIPAAAAAVTAGYEYYLKTRFADPNLLQQFDTHRHATIDSFMLEIVD